jgi:hypothetical protein
MSVYYNEIDPFAAAWLRGYGNAIVAPQAAAFIESYIEITSGATNA